MAEATLVKSDLTPDMVKAGRQLLHGLDRQKTPIDAAFWLYVPEGEQWRLVLGSPELRNRGPRRLYKRVQSVLSREEPTVPLSSVALVDSADPLVQTLSSVIKVSGGNGVRFSRNSINGQYIEDAYIYRMAA
jgi:hypothetical protein